MKLLVTLDVDVTNAASEAEARECAFKLASSMNGATKGRPSAGARASVTGIKVDVVACDVKLDGSKETIEK